MWVKGAGHRVQENLDGSIKIAYQRMYLDY